MAQFVWPQELDDARRLLAVVGSFWSETYAGSDLVASVLHAKAQQQAQAQLDLYELLASFSRFKVPVFHKENWSLLTLKESELNSSNLPKFDGAYTFTDGLKFDTPLPSATFAWPAPPGLVSANVISNQITRADFTLTRGTDFTLQDGVVAFCVNPFTLPNAHISQVFVAGQVTDRVLYLWVYAGEYDWDTVYRQFGYALDLKLKSSRTYKDLVNAVFDGLVTGTSAKCLDQFMSAVCDVPLAVTHETVQHVLSDAHGRWVITDSNAYAFSRAANVTVTPGTQLIPGQAMTDALTFFDFNCGQLPDSIQAISLGGGTLSAAFLNELVFENKQVPLVVEEDVDGFTKVSFALGGWPTDIEAFWESVHTQGVASNDTLAMRLDTRENRATQPTAVNLPATINPAKFLIENIYRGNAFAIVVRPQAFGPDAIGMHAARHLRRLVPPQTLCLLFVSQDFAESVTMVSPGTETTAGYAEDIATFLGSTFTETLLPETYVAEEVRVFQIGGYCV